MADIDLVVTNYRTPNDLELFCASVERQTDVDYTLTIVNVAPKPEDILCAEKWEHIGAKHVVFNENVGYGRASNFGASLGTAPIVALFNADVVIPWGQLGNVVREIQLHHGWHIVGPRQVDTSGLITHAGIIGTNEQPRFRAWREHVVASDYADTIECLSVMGAAYFVKRPAWEELTECELFQQFLEKHTLSKRGAFLPTRLYYEEMWTSLHARAHDMNVMYFGGATFMHEWHRSISAHLDNVEADAIFANSRDIFRACCKHHGISCE